MEAVDLESASVCSTRRAKFQKTQQRRSKRETFSGGRHPGGNLGTLKYIYGRPLLCWSVSPSVLCHRAFPCVQHPLSLSVSRSVCVSVCRLLRQHVPRPCFWLTFMIMLQGCSSCSPRVRGSLGRSLSKSSHSRPRVCCSLVFQVSVVPKNLSILQQQQRGTHHPSGQIPKYTWTVSQ